MKSLKLRKLIAATVAVLTIASVTPVGASAAWRQDSNGWWNTEGYSYSTGWRLIDGDWYYFDSVGYMKTGWVNDNGTWYYLQPSGAMKTGWANDNGTWYYLQSSGAMKTGWVNDGGTWYYLQSSGAMKTGWVNDGGTWYYLQPSGAMKTGWINDNGTWYFASSSGAMQTGVIEIDGKIYYFAPNGAMQTGTVVIDGVTYTFAPSGEAIGDKKPTPKLYFTSAGIQLAAPSDTDTTTSSSSGGGSHHSSGGSSSGNNGGTDSNDITSVISGAVSTKLTNFVAADPTLAKNIKVTNEGGTIGVQLLGQNLDSLQTVFSTAKNDSLGVLEARLTKAEGLMNAHSGALKIGDVAFEQYLKQAEDKYVASGGKSTYFKADGTFDVNQMATRIKDGTLTYDKFKKDLSDRVIAMCNEENKAPKITVSGSGMTQTVTKMEVDGKTLYDTNASIKANVEGLVNSFDNTTGTYKIYCGTGNQYFTVTVK